MAIFTDAQILKIHQRYNGDKSDDNGMFSRIRPRVIEILQILNTPESKEFWERVLKGGK